MDMTIADLKRFNEFLDSSIDPKHLSEKFITSCQVELEEISRNSDVKHFPLIALSYAKLLELTVFLAGTYSDNYRLTDFGDLVVNPRHLDVCVLNTKLIKEEYGITENIPRWFKGQVRESIGSQYAQDWGRMVVTPSALIPFVEKGLLLQIVRKERHGRLSEQFMDCIIDNPQWAFPEYIEKVKPLSHNPVKVQGCGCGQVECLEIASWLAGSTVLNMVENTLHADLMGMLGEVISGDYLKSINTKLEKTYNCLQYVSVGRTSFPNFPYDDEVRTAEWDDINHTLCNFTLEGYRVIQSELGRSLSDPGYRSPLLNSWLYNVPNIQETTGQHLPAKFQHHLTSPRQTGEMNYLN